MTSSSKTREAILPPEVVERRLTAAGEELVLVGDRALKTWVERYGIELPMARVMSLSRRVGR